MLDLIDFYSKELNVPYEAAKALIGAESAFNRYAVSPKGAKGLTQMMPAAMKEMGVTDPYDPEQSIKGGLGYYAKQRERFGPVGALYAYNWGPNNYAQYLAGKKKTIPKETEKYVAKLAPLVEGAAPMNLEGEAGYFPEVQQVSNPQPSIENPVNVPPQRTGDSGMEEYDKMVYSPYMQLAMGLLAGNTGVSRSDAFANAMRGGLSAVQNGQQYRYQAQQEKRKQQEYDKTLDDEVKFKKFASSMLEKNPGDTFWQAAAIDPKWGMEYYKAKEVSDYHKSALEIDKMRATAYAKSVDQYGAGTGGRFGGPDLNLTENDRSTLGAFMATRFGDEWGKLSPEQQTVYMATVSPYLKMNAAKGIPLESMELPPLPKATPEQPWYKKGIDILGPPKGKAVPQGTTPRGISRPAPREGWSVEVQ